MAGPSEAGEATTEGGGGQSSPGHSSMEDCSRTHEAVRPSSQSLTLEREPARDGSTVAAAVPNPDILVSEHKVGQPLFPFIRYFAALKADVCQSTVLKPLKRDRGGV